MILKMCIVRPSYLQRPSELCCLTYPDFFRWWDVASSSQQQKASSAASEGEIYSVNCRGCDDFASFMDASKALQNAQQSLSQLLHDSAYSPDTSEDVRALTRSMMYHDIPQVVVDAVLQYYERERN